MTLQGALRFDRNWSFSPEQTIPAVGSFLATPLRLPGNARRDRLQGHLAARRPRVRPVRQREDGGQGELRQVPGADEQQQQLHPVEPDRPHRDDGRARLDRLQRQLRSRTATCGIRRRRTSRPPVATSAGRCNAQTFGTTAQTTAAIDPKILSGWSVRSNDWQIGASVQQQVLPRVSVEVGYFRRWLNNFTITDNLARRPRPTSRRTASPRRRIRGCLAAAATRSTGSTTSCRASSARPATTSRSRTTSASSIRRYNGVLFNVSARLGAGVQFQGGINSGKTVKDNCAVRAQLPELTTVAGVSPAVNPGNPYCHADPGLHHQGHGARQLHRAEDRRARSRARSAATRARPGAPPGTRRWRWSPRPSAVRPTSSARRCRSAWWRLVRCGAIASTHSICASPRSSGSVACGTTSGSTSINVTNSNAILTYNQNFNPAVTTGSQAWLAPQSVLTPRFFKLGAQIDF